MLSITARNVNDAYVTGLMFLRNKGEVVESRNGRTIEYPDNVSVRYACPTERVLFDPVRNINPFLHFFEPLWILAGRSDVEFLSYIVQRFKEYSDNGAEFHGAYGMRIRRNRAHKTDQSFDQMEIAIDTLSKNPDDRRCVLMIRRPEDALYTGKDQPCNIAVTLKVRKGKLNISVYNRSNDFIWGMTGANMPQFSMIQEYMAGLIGVEVGTYHHITDSCHAYIDNPQWEAVKNTPINHCDPYVEPDIVTGHYPAVTTYPLFTGMDLSTPASRATAGVLFQGDLYLFFHEFYRPRNSSDPDYGHRVKYATPFFNEVVHPMTVALHKYKTGDIKAAKRFARLVAAQDWRLATLGWLHRIENNRAKA